MQEGVEMLKRLIRNKKELKTIRSKLRRNMTASELVLWQKIRGGLLGVKFRRQYSVENIILDFYSPSTRLGIEIDGESHFADKQAALNDKIRDSRLAKQGIKVLRFTNRDIMENLEGVINKILDSTPS